jgi:putative SOS response-associated peptidase YedK
MCGRFTLTDPDPRLLRFRFDLRESVEIEEEPRFNIAPTDPVLAVRRERESGEREAGRLRWGLIPHYADPDDFDRLLINARVETVAEAPAFRDAFEGRFRCLIPADGFYEWMRAEDPKQPRQPWRFTVDDGAPFAFAGICTRKEWEDPEDRGFDDGWLYSCTIVTTTPNELVAKVHNRMPAILPDPEAEAAWLRPDLELEDAVAMCTTLPADRMQSAPANPKLNKVGKGMEEGPKLLIAP